uniref:Uncharacterized protein n=1 Tax=Lactuca sativa TaxID=4236 RepID=A0A9R1XF72_LACSA|nr:hypothetical protein LSAT_V11C500275430 [Lactuca sativa]
MSEDVRRLWSTSALRRGRADIFRSFLEVCPLTISHYSKPHCVSSTTLNILDENSFRVEQMAGRKYIRSPGQKFWYLRATGDWWQGLSRHKIRRC